MNVRKEVSSFYRDIGLEINGSFVFLTYTGNYSKSNFNKC